MFKTHFLWNPDGVHYHKNKLLYPQQQLDIVFISETHLTIHKKFKFLGTRMSAHHADNFVHSGAAIIDKNTVQCS